MERRVGWDTCGTGRRELCGTVRGSGRAEGCGCWLEGVVAGGVATEIAGMDGCGIVVTGGDVEELVLGGMEVWDVAATAGLIA